MWYDIHFCTSIVYRWYFRDESIDTGLFFCSGKNNPSGKNYDKNTILVFIKFKIPKYFGIFKWFVNI